MTTALLLFAIFLVAVVPLLQPRWFEMPAPPEDPTPELTKLQRRAEPVVVGIGQVNQTRYERLWAKELLAYRCVACGEVGEHLQPNFLPDPPCPETQGPHHLELAEEDDA